MLRNSEAHNKFSTEVVRYEQFEAAGILDPEKEESLLQAEKSKNTPWRELKALLGLSIFALAVAVAAEHAPKASETRIGKVGACVEQVFDRVADIQTDPNTQSLEVALPTDSDEQAVLVACIAANTDPTQAIVNYYDDQRMQGAKK